MGGADVAVPDQFRDYQLAVVFGYTPSEIDAASATRLDWLLACHGAVESVKAEKQREASRG